MQKTPVDIIDDAPIGVDIYRSIKKTQQKVQSKNVEKSAVKLHWTLPKFDKTWWHSDTLKTTVRESKEDISSTLHASKRKISEY